MLKNGLFVMALGFVALILGLTSTDEHQFLTLLIGILLTIIGFVIYNQAEQKED